MKPMETAQGPLNPNHHEKPNPIQAWIGVAIVVICFVGIFTFSESRGLRKKEAMVLVGDTSRYYLSSASNTWKQKQTACATTGGQLASIHSASENHEVAKVCKNKRGCWIGLNDMKVNEKWVWSDGTAYNYANWNTGEPNVRRNQACVQIYEHSAVKGKWNDLSCKHKLPAVCEKVAKISSYSCSPGLYLLTTGPSSCVCKKCPAGRSCKGGKMKPVKCLKGSYQPLSGQNSCKLASPGTYVDRTGAKKAKECKRGHMCPGTGNTSPIPCNYGTYQKSKGKAKCIPASPGAYVPRRGLAKQTSCPRNSFQTCSGQKTCIECPIGKKQPKVGSTWC